MGLEHTNKMLEQILENQRCIMIHLSKGPFYEGYFSENIKETEELL